MSLECVERFDALRACFSPSLGDIKASKLSEIDDPTLFTGGVIFLFLLSFFCGIREQDEPALKRRAFVLNLECSLSFGGSCIIRSREVTDSAFFCLFTPEGGGAPASS